MAKYKVYEVDKRTTRTGKDMAKLVLQGEGKQYPDKNVTMWGDHPLFDTIAPGQEIDVELDIRDSKTANPNGGFYKDKTVLKPGATAPAAAASSNFQVGNAEILNAINLKVMPTLQVILARLDRIDNAIDGVEDVKPAEIPGVKDAIQPEDIPF